MKTISNIKNKLTTRSRQRKAVRQLESMTDRQLMDIGITRGTIRASVYDRH